MKTREGHHNEINFENFKICTKAFSKIHQQAEFYGQHSTPCPREYATSTSFKK
jgi:hypothetical protein